MTDTPDHGAAVRRIAAEIARRDRFLVTSHVQPDGDAIGSSLAMAYALRSLGKSVQVVFKDAAPEYYRAFPGVTEIEIADHVASPLDAVVVMECSTLARTGVAGLEQGFVINVDHHAGNTRYGDIDWFDETAAACGEMIHDLIRELGVPIDRTIATHLYLAILTDTGGFHHSHISARTFEIGRVAAEAGVDAAAVARQVFNSSSIGKLKLTGELLTEMELVHDDRVAVLHLDDAMLERTGCERHDTEGLINLPLMAASVRAVVMFKGAADGSLKVSLRSKDNVDVRLIAHEFGGGGHQNAAGFTAPAPLETLGPALLERVARAVGRSTATA